MKKKTPVPPTVTTTDVTVSTEFTRITLPVQKTDHDLAVEVGCFKSDARRLAVAFIAHLRCEITDWEKHPSSHGDIRGFYESRDDFSGGFVLVSFDFTPSDLEVLDHYRSLVRRKRETLLRGFVSDTALRQKDEMEVAKSKAEWEARKRLLPTLYRHYVEEIERERRSSAEMYGKIRDGKLWPVFPKSRRGHPPMEAKEVAGTVFVSIALPEYALNKVSEMGASFEGAVRAMTTWGGDGLLRDDVEEAWFGEPGTFGKYSIGGRIWGMLNYAGLFMSGRAHRRVQIVLPVELFSTIKIAADYVHATPEQWIYGCIAGFDRDPKASNSDLTDRRRDAARAIKEWEGDTDE